MDVVLVRTSERKHELTHPESTCEEGDHAAPESGLLALRGDAFVHAFPEPDVGLHVPGIQKDLEVGWELDFHDSHVGCTFPLRLSLCVETSESKTGEDGSTLLTLSD
jgi:hypothetical protein